MSRPANQSGFVRAGHDKRFRHGHAVRGKMSGTYHSWYNMLKRCENPKSINFTIYGARGITVCHRWHVFANFLADMGIRPKGRTLDRENNEGNYEPGNCRWATKSEQAFNRRRKYIGPLLRWDEFFSRAARTHNERRLLWGLS